MHIFSKSKENINIYEAEPDIMILVQNKKVPVFRLAEVRGMETEAYMIGEIFKALIITSLAGSAFALLVTLVRPITKKLFGYLWHYYVWIAVLLVMVMPIQFSIVKGEDINIPAAQESIQAEEFTQM